MYNEFYKYLLSSSSDFQIKEENEGTIFFEHNGLNYLFDYDNNDPYYLRLMLPNIVKEGEKDINLNNIINEYNAKYKVIKLSIINNSLWLIIEQFVYSKENLNDLFSRIISILETVFLNLKRDIDSKP